MSFVRKIKRGKKTYYAEVENIRINGKVVQKHIRSLGTNPEYPPNVPIEPVHFSFIAIGLMQGTLTPNDIFEMLENMGHKVRKEQLERIGINYHFTKKTFYVYLYYQKKSIGRGTQGAQSAEKHSKSRRLRKEL